MMELDKFGCDCWIQFWFLANHHTRLRPLLSVPHPHPHPGPAFGPLHAPGSTNRHMYTASPPPPPAAFVVHPPVPPGWPAPPPPPGQWLPLSPPPPDLAISSRPSGSKTVWVRYRPPEGGFLCAGGFLQTLFRPLVLRRSSFYCAEHFLRLTDHLKTLPK